MKYFYIIGIIFSLNIAHAGEAPFPFREEYLRLLNKKYILIPHKGTFLMPLSYNANPNNKIYNEFLPPNLIEERGDFNKNTEVEFQISFLILTNKNIFNSSFSTFIGYTHQAWWQVYNTNWSRPFRETNYTPEIFFRKIVDTPVSFLGGKIIVYDFGLVHQSNGQTQELSRSWNRIFFRFVNAYKKLIIKTTVWYRIPESDGLDENPDIVKYNGYGEVDLKYKIEKSDVNLRLIPGTKYLGAELSYSYPWKEGLRFFLKASQGYGLSMIDYNHNNKKIGLGIILADPFTK